MESQPSATHSAAPPAAAAKPTADAGFAGLFLGLLLVAGIAAVLTAAAKLGGWFWLGPLAMVLAAAIWFGRTRNHYRDLIRAALQRNRAAAADLAQAHCHAAAIEQLRRAGPLAARLHDDHTLAAIELDLDQARQAETAAVERLAFVLYGLHAGRETALARLHAETVVNLTGLSVHDEVLEALPSLPSIRRLHLRGPFITDKTLRYAAHTRALIELYLENTAITDEGLRRFRAEAWTPGHPDREIAELQRAADCREREQAAAAEPSAERDPSTPAQNQPAEINDLKFLHLEATPITDAGLACLAPFTALERLSLHKTKITGAGLAALAPLQHLKRLSLDGQSIGDEAIEHLAQLPNLERLELFDTRIAGGTLGQLQACAKLEHLDLSHAPLTDAAVEGLVALTTLKHLRLNATPLSPGAIDHLRIHLKGCKIAI